MPPLSPPRELLLNYDENPPVYVSVLKVCLSYCADKGHTYAGTQYASEVSTRTSSKQWHRLEVAIHPTPVYVRSHYVAMGGLIRTVACTRSTGTYTSVSKYSVPLFG